MTTPTARKRKHKSVAPDLRPRVTQHTAPPWQELDPAGEPKASSPIVAKLAEKHSFPTDFPLEGHLNFAWLTYQASKRNGSPPTGTDLKAYWDAVISQASGLSETLRLGGSYVAGIVSGTVRVDELVDQLQNLERLARIAKRHVEKTRAGRHGDVALRLFLAAAYGIYRKAHGHQARLYTKETVSSSCDENTYKGPLVDFFADLLSLLQVKKSNSALGKIIERLVSTKA